MNAHELAEVHTVRVGSLCTGYAGLDAALGAVCDTTPAWYAENDAAPSRLLAERFPNVPNLGDLTVIDWSSVASIDVLAAGYPCQPFSQAGQRRGSKDERHLWPFIRDAIRALRPHVVVLENVAGHLSLGFDRVLADLAELRFDAEWTLLRASDVGACHQRARLFVVATDSEREPVRDGRRGRLPRAQGPSEGDGPQRQRIRPGARDGGEDAPDADDGRRSERDQGERRLPIAREGDAQPLADPDRGRLEECSQQDGRTVEPQLGASRRGDADGRDAAAWGAYEPAIRRHERVLGRPAPAPVDEGGRLSPLFVEWMMMLPLGWVTDIGLPRSVELKMLGNGVVPPQAAHALRGLIGRAA